MLLYTGKLDVVERTLFFYQGFALLKVLLGSQICTSFSPLAHEMEF